MDVIPFKTLGTRINDNQRTTIKSKWSRDKRNFVWSNKMNELSISVIYGIGKKNSGKIYIGKTGNLDIRIMCHFNNLESNFHGNYKLQFDYNTSDINEFR